MSHPPAPWRAWRIAPWAVLGAIAVASAAGAPAATALARLFFVGAIVAGLIAAAGLAGPRTQFAVALGLLALVLVQRVADRPVPEPPSSQWTAPLRTPAEAIRHTIALPADAQWERLWQRAAGAAVYVCARGLLTEDDGLQLDVNDEPLGTLTHAHTVGPRPQPTSVGFYRVPVGRDVLERRRPATFTLRRAAGAPAAPDPAGSPVEICGTFTYRPTAGRDASAYFDGARWTSPGTTQQGRFLIELRFEDRAGRILEALY